MTLFLAVLLCFTNMQCEDDDISNDTDGLCNEVAIVNNGLYEDLASDDFQFVNVDITGDCLNIKVGASGCDGNTWEFQLVDSGAVAESLPEQRFLKLRLTNEELCDAFFERTISFDIRSLQIQGSNKIILNIDGFADSITYAY